MQFFGHIGILVLGILCGMLMPHWSALLAGLAGLLVAVMMTTCDFEDDLHDIGDDE